MDDTPALRALSQSPLEHEVVSTDRAKSAEESARAEEAQRATGYERGTITPFGSANDRFDRHGRHAHGQPARTRGRRKGMSGEALFPDDGTAQTPALLTNNNPVNL